MKGMDITVACERRRFSGCHGDKRQPEIRRRSQANITGADLENFGKRLVPMVLSLPRTGS